jgi:hypothetical protein
VTNFFGRRNHSLVPFFPFLLLLFTTPSFGQSLGLKFAYPTTTALATTVTNPDITYSAHGQAPKFGITGELGLGLPWGLLVEIDAMYSRLSYAATDTATLERMEVDVNSWDFPVLVKKKFFKSAVTPFVDGGAAFRAVNANTSKNNLQPPELIHQASAGFAFGGGLDFKVGKIHILPEFRYSQFGRENFRSLTGSLHSNLVQPMFVLGLQRSK